MPNGNKMRGKDKSNRNKLRLVIGMNIKKEISYEH